MKQDKILFSRETDFSLSINEATKMATLEGYAMVWGAISEDRGGYHVRLLPNSAKYQTPTFALYNHQFSNVLARYDGSESDSLRIINDAIGAKVSIDLPNTTLGRDIQELVGKRLIRGMSFAMLPGKFSDTTENGQKIRNYSEFGVDEVTITPIPAFTETSIEIAKPDNSLESTKELDAMRLKLKYNRLWEL